MCNKPDFEIGFKLYDEATKNWIPVSPEEWITGTIKEVEQ